MCTAVLAYCLMACSGSAFVIVPSARMSAAAAACAPRQITILPRMSRADDEIVSPFALSGDDGDGRAATATAAVSADVYLDLTWENVEKVLDGMRHYLIQDGGNVVIADIDGPVVKLELQGACGTCPSSTQTMKMGCVCCVANQWSSVRDFGAVFSTIRVLVFHAFMCALPHIRFHRGVGYRLERGLKEKIPEIQEVIQSMPQGPPLTAEQVDVVLDGVRPFLQVVGGTIDLDRLEGVDGLKPMIWLQMQGNSASLNSVKLEIAQRLQRHFMMSGLAVEWKE